MEQQSPWEANSHSN